MNNDKRMIQHLKSAVIDLMDRFKDGHNYGYDAEYDIEELYSMLNLDIEFTNKEIAILHKNKFKISKSKVKAFKSYRGVPVSVGKCNYNEYILAVGKPNSVEEVNKDFFDLNDFSNDLDFVRNAVKLYNSNLKD